MHGDNLTTRWGVSVISTPSAIHSLAPLLKSQYVNIIELKPNVVLKLFQKVTVPKVMNSAHGKAS